MIRAADFISNSKRRLSRERWGGQRRGVNLSRPDRILRRAKEAFREHRRGLVILVFRIFGEGNWDRQAVLVSLDHVLQPEPAEKAGPK